ncbi:hypothetical protein FZW96_20910 [Bacillus sp. BGMRC 2118]|nr:hypothetical protein FZW96_20910 [Bacillus sp. BGMRC 2118]
MIPKFSLQPISKWIFYLLFVGTPFSVILNAIVLTKRNEKKMIAVFGLLISLILTSSIVYLILLANGIGEA